MDALIHLLRMLGEFGLFGYVSGIAPDLRFAGRKQFGAKVDNGRALAPKKPAGAEENGLGVVFWNLRPSALAAWLRCWVQSVLRVA